MKKIVVSYYAALGAPLICTCHGLISWISTISFADVALTNSAFMHESRCSPKVFTRHQETNLHAVIHQKEHKLYDTRPHEQRREGPRTARRMNHSFQQLYRHDEDDPTDNDDWRDPSSRFPEVNVFSITPKEFLINEGGYESSEVDEMIQRFPPLANLDVQRHLEPKLKFFKYTLGGADVDPRQCSASSPNSLDKLNNLPSKQVTITPSMKFLANFTSILSAVKQQKHRTQNSLKNVVHLRSDARMKLLPQLYGARLEKVLAPRHAFLVYLGLPCGRTLLDNQLLLAEFSAARSSRQFADLCNNWIEQYSTSSISLQKHITKEKVEAFEVLFSRGLMAAARNELQARNVDMIPDLDSSTLVALLISHGANPRDTDIRDISLLHWACGAGNIGAVKALVSVLGVDAIKMRAARDGATPLHWAACGVRSKHFGSGGSLELCRWIIEGNGLSIGEQINLVNAVTKDGNSILMWAAWSGSLDVIKLLMKYQPDVSVRNRNGCSVAHWAASGGKIDLCQYLSDQVGVSFDILNHAGNSPLSHAIAYGRADVVSWLLEKQQDTDKAKALAREFSEWSKGDPSRMKIFDMFE